MHVLLSFLLRPENLSTFPVYGPIKRVIKLCKHTLHGEGGAQGQKTPGARQLPPRDNPKRFFQLMYKVRTHVAVKGLGGTLV